MIQTNRLAVIGNVDSGKSTLIGVMARGLKDDGRGLAREKVMNFKHEKQNGQTSSIAHEIMGFYREEQVYPEHLQSGKAKFWKDVVEKADQIITLFDMCGHEKFLRTTIKGMMQMAPNYSLILVGANMGISKMTREHIGLSLFLKIPMIIIITKIDIAPPNVYQETVTNLKNLIKGPAIKKAPVQVTLEEINKWTALMPSNQIVPIFEISSVTCQGLDLLKKFICRLPNSDDQNKNLLKATDPFQINICEYFNISGIGYVVGGLVVAGTVKVGQILLLGPDKTTRTWKSVVVKSIQVSRASVQEATIGQFACIAIKTTKQTEKLDKTDFRKGSVMVDPVLKPEAVREFMANIHVLHHATTMALGCECVMHHGSIEQAVEIMHFQTKEFLRSGDTELVKFRFVYHAEFIRPGSVMLLREGRTKVFGIVTEVIQEQVPLFQEVKK